MNKYNYFDYIISNWNNKVVYVGVTNNLELRLYEYKNKLVNGFTRKYNLAKLVYFEVTSDIKSAIQREKEIKKWRCEIKNQLIESMNPKWEDLQETKKIKISQSNEKHILVRNDKPKVIGLIISAGLSRRMGKFKPLLKFKGKSFLNNVAERLTTVCDKIILVTGHNAEVIQNHILTWDEQLRKKTKVIHNSNYKEGMFTSVKRGVAEISNCKWVLYHFVDQPTIPEEFYTEFVHQIDNKYDWIQPVFNGQKGHPILFSEKVISLIQKAGDNSNLKKISSSTELNKKYWECNYEEILIDFDLPEDVSGKI